MSEDICRPVEVDGQIVRVHGSKPMNQEDQNFFAALVRAAKDRYKQETTVTNNPFDAVYAAIDDLVVDQGEQIASEGVWKIRSAVDALAQQVAPEGWDAERVADHD